MRVVIAVYLAFGAIVAAVLIYGWRHLPPRPVRFKTIDEVDCIGVAAAWATHQLRIDQFDRKLLLSNQLWRRWYPIWFPQLVRIPKEELAVLAPFIDEFIHWRGPPLNLPLEYEDYRPRVLAGFKARMQSEGLWPAEEECHSGESRNPPLGNSAS